MKILALSTNNPYHQDLLEELRLKYNIIADIATSHKAELEKENRPYYKKYATRLIDGKAFYQINQINKIIPVDAPVLDKQILEYFSHIERDFYIISDRYSFFPKSFRTRKRLFRYGLRYWLDFFAKNKIDAIFTPCAPHNFPDYTAFHVAKYLNIPVLMTTDVMINDHVLILSDYREVIKVPENYMENDSDEKIIATIPPKLYNNAFRESIQINISKHYNDRSLGLKNLNDFNDENFVEKKKIAKRAKLKNRLKKYFSTSPYRPRFKANFAMNRQYSDFVRRFFRIVRSFTLKKLKSDYEALAITPDLNINYIYFAMHLTPERTTQPEAEVFEDHLLAIEILAKSVPKDWLIYVKENPGQASRKINFINGKGYRDISDYKDFTRHPNVRLIRQNIKSSELIQKAKIVSSLRGSVGWESLAQGKGCITFGNAFYSACRSAYRVSSVAECKEVIKEILTKTPAEVKTDKLKFLAYMQSRIVIGSMGAHEVLAMVGEPYKNLLGNLASVLAAMFEE